MVLFPLHPEGWSFRKTVYMKNRIVLSDSDIRKMVAESVKRLLKEERTPFYRNVAPHIRDKVIKKVASEHPELDPKGFYYTSTGDLVHNGKKKIKSAPKEKLSKPENMSVEEYYQNIVLPNNPKMAQKENQYADEDWRPVQNIGRYFNGDVDYGSYYLVSNYGRLKVINFNNAIRSDIYVGYDAPTRKAMQFHLNGYGDDGASMKTCPDVKYIVADAWLEPHDTKKFKVIHIDGDYHNNHVDNLKWVPKKAQR